MPTVPTLDNFGVAPAALPSARQESIASPALFDAGAEKQMRLGEAAIGAGNAFSRIQQQADQVRADDGLNKFRGAVLDLTYNKDNGYAGKKGDVALKPDADGMALPDSYAAKLKKVQDEISVSLGNTNQQQLFNRHADNIATQFKGGVQSHMLQEYQHFALSTQDGTIKIGTDTAVSNWFDNSDTGPRQQAIDSVKSAVAKAGQLTSEGASETVAKMKVAESGIHLGVVDAALQNSNPSYALDYFDKHKTEMTADDVLKVQKSLHQQVDASLALGAVSDATRTHASAFAPTEFDRLAGVVGQDVAKGENPTIVNDTLQNFVTKYGDAAKAVAAMYAPTPEAVDEAIKKATEAKNPAAWLTYLPKNTQDYVTSKMTAFAAGQGAPKPPTELEYVNTALSKLPTTARPELIKLTSEQASRQYKLIQEDHKQRGDQAESDVQQALIANGGDFAALDPQIKSNLSRLEPQAYVRAQDFAKKVNGPSETNLAAYSVAVAHPEELAKMSEAQFLDFAHTNFTMSDQKKISDLRAEVLTGKVTETTDSINSPKVNTLLNERLNSIGINPEPKKGDTAELAHVGAIQKFVREDIYAQQKQLGRKMTDVEVEKHIDGLFAKSVDLPGVLWGTNSKNLLSVEIGDIPKDVRERIKAAYAARGVSNPSNTDITRSFWKWKNGR